MRLTALVFALCVAPALIVLAPPAVAGDADRVAVHGFTADGGVFVFEVFGSYDGLGGGHATWYAVDLARDRWLDGTPVSVSIGDGHPVGSIWITDAELAERPELVRTMSVKPPSGGGRVRLLRIGTDDAPVDLQPCGGTHVANVAEIGGLAVAKIENKGKQNRRVNIVLVDPA